MTPGGFLLEKFLKNAKKIVPLLMYGTPCIFNNSMYKYIFKVIRVFTEIGDHFY